MLLLFRDVPLIDADTTAIMSTWRELFATTVRGVNRVVFYGAPPPVLLTVFSTWSYNYSSMVLYMASRHSEARSVAQAPAWCSSSLAC